MSILDDAYISFLNLDSRPDRRQRMERTLSDVGLPAVRTRGGREYLGDAARVRKMRDRTPGTVGCWAGQVYIMSQALIRDQHAFVMEDDLVFCSDFWDRWQVIEGFLESHPWDVFWFGGTFHVNPPVWHKDTLGKDVERTDNPRIVRTYGCWSTYAYLVNRTSIKSILRMLDEGIEDTTGIDTSFITQIEPLLHTYAFVPGCVKQYDDRSDIGNGMTIFSGFSKLGPYWWADRMGEFDPTSFDWGEAG